MTNLKQLFSGSKFGSKWNPTERVDIGRPGDIPQLILWRGRIFLYNPAGQTIIDGGILTAIAIAAGSITADKLAVGAKKFVHNISFTALDYNTVSWTAGNLVKADGTTVGINASNTGNITAKTYIYFNNTANLQTTTLYGTAIGGNNIPLAVIEPDSDVLGKAIVTSFLKAETTVSGDVLTTGKVQSALGHTYFDLNNDTLVVNDRIHDRIIIGKIGTGHGIKVSLQGYDAIDDQDINHFALWASSDDTEDNVIIKEKIRGSSSVPTGYANKVEIAHGLAYIPLVLVFAEESSGVYVKLYGADSFDPFYWFIDDTYLHLVNVSGTTKTFKYYIFYDQLAS